MKLVSKPAFILSLVLITSLCYSQSPQTHPQNPTTKPIDPALVQIEDDPNLPRVLLIGDSISMGYTLPVREMMKGKANIHHPAVNCAWSANGVKNVQSWLGTSKWDVITFNFGLHDLKYVDEQMNMVALDKGKQLAAPEEYAQNLREIIKVLKGTGAKIIWCNTTPVPAGTMGRVEGSEQAYNTTADKVIAENGLPTIDLHAVVIANPKLQLPKNVHFSKEGYTELAKHIVEQLKKTLESQGGK